MNRTGASWFKSSRSDAGNGSCVEIAFMADAVGVRDSKDQPGGPVLPFSPASWRSFIAGVKAGEFNR
ncbi:DUF397 domain-containing protein [Catellatospora methionotrophica]|uniref:DUF397 domain-containing protein n=1 Tax=Catellatospora methionotrophica TaxID=121620 RepID=A0A8J3LFA7_9ACTN|nr:DUF397 domain-containing protein [Catellatospora methionotrophica]GIG13375.1 DUF397 domain-containing protein [Catellatospora methionotrophica]